MQETVNAPIQRREFPRYKINDPIKIKLKTIKNIDDVDGEAINLSKHGVCVKFIGEVQVSERVEVKIHLANGEVSNNKGRVIWLDNKLSLCGIDFTEYKEDLSDYWLGYIAGISTSGIDRREIQERRNKVSVENSDVRKSERRETKSVFLKCLRYSRAKNLQKAGLFCLYREFQSSMASKIMMNGKEFIMFGSNDYLGFSNHPEIIETGIKTIEKYGVGTGGSRILCGTMDLHNELEKKIADFIGGEDCIFYNTGYDANLGTISSLLDNNGYLIIDEASHASMVDGGLLANAKIEVFKHNDMKSLERKLKKIDINESKIIAIDGVYSMDGDICTLPEIYALGKKYNAGILLDDGHAIGVLGQNGKGTAEHLGFNYNIDLNMGTLSKALGGIGGYIVANKDIIHYLRSTSRSFLFTSSMSPIIVAINIKALELVQTRPEIREKLWININYMKNRLIEENFDIGNTNSPIIPVILGDEKIALFYAKELEKVGIYATPAIYPSVKKNKARLRVGIMTTHTIEDIEYFVYNLVNIKKKLTL